MSSEEPQINLETRVSTMPKHTVAYNIARKSIYLFCVGFSARAIAGKEAFTPRVSICFMTAYAATTLTKLRYQNPDAEKPVFNEVAGTTTAIPLAYTAGALIADMYIDHLVS